MNEQLEINADLSQFIFVQIDENWEKPSFISYQKWIFLHLFNRVIWYTEWTDFIASFIFRHRPVCEWFETKTGPSPPWAILEKDMADKDIGERGKDVVLTQGQNLYCFKNLSTGMFEFTVWLNLFVGYNTSHSTYVFSTTVECTKWGQSIYIKCWTSFHLRIFPIS